MKESLSSHSSPSPFTDRDRGQLAALGMEENKVRRDLDTFKKGTRYTHLERACTVGDGITSLLMPELERLSTTQERAAAEGRFAKFVPASGASTRMFKALLAVLGRPDGPDEELLRVEASQDGFDAKETLEFLDNLSRFPFQRDVSECASRRPEGEKELHAVLECLLTDRGLNYANQPKGLIPFHSYSDQVRTPIDEHMVEAAEYIKSAHGLCRIHFTVSPEHRQGFEEFVSQARTRWEEDKRGGARYDITFSVQKSSTDTIAVDLENRPFRDPDQSLVFRPGGHGALLENLQDLGADIIYIKNIDNVVPDRLRSENVLYKKALGGYLVELQKRTFNYLERLMHLDKGADPVLLEDIFRFVDEKLGTVFSDAWKQSSPDHKHADLLEILNRPMRVCAMVRNQGEPGGGPFWVRQKEGSNVGGLSLQIVETSQIDMDNPDQRAIASSSTHFNPTDLVCGLRDFQNRPFDLSRYVDSETFFISRKSRHGKELKALELPGLWNGSMAHWNTVFLEVPVSTFNPVKTVNDLLRPAHQA